MSSDKNSSGLELSHQTKTNKPLQTMIQNENLTEEDFRGKKRLVKLKF